MNILEINIGDCLPHIIDAYIEVFGEKYSDIIKERVNKANYTTLTTLDGMMAFRNFYCTCKQKELCIEFLKEIGKDVSEYEKISYAENLEDNIDDLLENYFGSYMGINPSYNKILLLGLNSFDSNIIHEVFSSGDIEDIEKIESSQISFLNFLREDSTNPITKDNFEEFKNTSEYQSLLSTINVYLEIYRKKQDMYSDYLKELKTLDDEIDKQETERREIIDTKKMELFIEIYPYLPDTIVEKLNENNSTIEEMCKKIFPKDIIFNSNIEYFSKEDSLKLEDKNSKEHEIALIAIFRLEYFRGMGIEYDTNAKPIEEYKKLIQREDVKKLIPSEDLVKRIKECREQKKEEADRKFFSVENGGEGLNDLVYSTIKKEVSAFYSITTEDHHTARLIMLSILGYSECGFLDYILLHEFCHNIECCIEETKLHISGWNNTHPKANKENNPYDSQKGLYERINENFADIFAIEARENLHKKGIYMLEPKEQIKKEINRNTYKTTRNMLKPFLVGYRNEIIESRINADVERIKKYVGAENFDNLNDIVNKVDYLCKIGLERELEKQGNDTNDLVKQYNEQMVRLKDVYSNMNVPFLDNMVNEEPSAR